MEILVGMLRRMRRYAALLLSMAAGAWGQIPITGTPVPGLEVFDNAMTQLMMKYRTPGAALAVASAGRLVYARGFGYADQEAQIKVQPDSLFRIASITKPHTAAAILKLIEQGKLTLDAKAFQILSKLQPPPGAMPDPRLQLVTIQNLLEHKGGWDRDGTGYDPMFDAVHAAQVVGATVPANCEVMIRYMLTRRLDFDPGTRSSYSNFGYCVLGRVIQEITGVPYDLYVKANVLGPLGNTRTALGKTLRSQQLPGEAVYYDYPGAPLAQSVFPNGGLVPWPYGGFFMDAHNANGGWVSSTIELLRYLLSVNGSRGPSILQFPPAGFVFYVPPVGRGWGWIFDGSLPGNNASLRLDDRTAWCFLTNTRPAGANNFFDDFDKALVAAGQAVTAWPTGDIFPQFATAFSVSHAATFVASAAAPDQYVALSGTDLATTTAVASDGINLPATLAGMSVAVTDSLGARRSAKMYYVSPTQINCIVPDGTAPGVATITLQGSGRSLSTMIQIDPVSPGIFTANANGLGAPAALGTRLKPDNSQSSVAIFQCSAANGCAPAPIDLGPAGDQVILALYATGVRRRSDLSKVRVSIGGQSSDVLFAGDQVQYPGLDQVNVRIPRALIGRGLVDLVMQVDGRTANTVRLNIR